MTTREKILNYIDDAEYVSFDIFDTLLFRMVRSPERIFSKMFLKAPSLFPEYLMPEDWVKIRQWAQTYAADEMGEARLEEIYAKLPPSISCRNELMKLEVECEKEYSYINPEIEEILYELSDKYHKKIILISDMYLSKEVMLEILKHDGLKLDKIHQIFISCEYGKTKKSGELYPVIADKLKCAPDKILHIGDNRRGDVANAKRAGIKTVYYPVVSEWFSAFPFLLYEREMYGEICEKNHCLRLLAANGAEKYSADEKVLFEVGAMILGPLVTDACRWVIDLAKENEISDIFPIMREGKFLAKMLEAEKKYRGWNGNIRPIYISRRALYPALLSIIKEKDIGYCFRTQLMTVEGLFQLIEMDIPAEFKDYSDVELKKSKDICYKNDTLYNVLISYLCDETVLDTIRNANPDADALIFQYFSQLGMTDRDYITFDVGWRGNMQNAIQRIMKRHDVTSHGIHLLMNGRETILQERNLEDACDIRGFSSNYGSEDNQIRKMNLSLFEMFFMCDEGTTVGYEKGENEIIPVLKNIDYDSEQRNAVRCVQEGVLHYQALSFKLRKKGVPITETKQSESLALVTRLFDKPTKKEAETIGKISFDQNFGVDSSRQFISEKRLEQYRERGICQYMTLEDAREDDWCQGMEAILNPLDTYISWMMGTKGKIQYKYCLYVKSLEHFDKEFVLVGAGKHLTDVLGFLMLLNKADLIEAVIDGNPALEGETFCGIPIRSYSYRPKNNIFVLTVSSPAVSREMEDKLKRIHGNDIQILSMR